MVSERDIGCIYTGDIKPSTAAAFYYIIGWASYWSWLMVATGFSSLTTRNSSDFSTITFITLVSTLALLFARLLFAAFSKRFDCYLTNARCVVAASIVITVGAAMSMGVYYVSALEVLTVLGPLIMGTGSAWLSASWTQAFSKIKPGNSLPFIALGFFIASLIKLSCYSAPLIFSELLSVGLPLLSGLCLVALFLQAEDTSSEGGSLSESDVMLAPIPKSYIGLLILGIMSYGLAGTVVRAIAKSSPAAVEVTAELATCCHLLGMGMCALVFCVVFLLLSMRDQVISTRSLSNVVLLVMALAIALPAVFSTFSIYVSSILVGVGNGCLEILLLAYAALITRTRGVSAFVTICIAFGPMEAANLLGHFLGRVIGLQIEVGALEWSSLAIVALLVFIAVSLFAFFPFDDKMFKLVDISDTAEKNPAALPADRHEATDSPLSAGIIDVSWMREAYSLTERELDVARLLAVGRNIPSIQSALCISRGTAQTHAYHIYQKTGVHSRQELMDLVESHGGWPTYL